MNKIKLDDLEDRPYLLEERNVILLPPDGRFDFMLEVNSNAKLVVLKGRSFYVVPNNPTNNHLLYQAGHQVPSSIYFDPDFDWSGVKFFAGQALMAGLLVSRRRAMNLSQMGTGKTIGTLLAIDYLIFKKYIGSALVVAPLSILRTVWEDTIYARFPRLKPAVLHGTKQRRQKVLRQSSWNVAIVNFDGVEVIHADLLQCKFGLIVIDEVSVYRDHRTKRWKLMDELIQPAPFAAGLTGSPTPNSLADAYGIARLLFPERIRMSYTAFRDTVEKQVSPYKWVPRSDGKEKVYQLLQPAVRLTRAEVVELKTLRTQTHRVELSKKQIDAITALRKEAVAQFPEGVVTAVHAAALLIKLMQICAGVVYTSDKTPVDLDAHHRVEVLKTIIDGADGKVIVFVPFKHTMHLLRSKLEKEYGVAVVNGDVPNKERTKIFRAFQDPRDTLRVLLAHPAVAAHGLTLTEANVVVWFAPIHSREAYSQACARISRIGQEREQLIAHLSGHVIEDRIYRALDNRGEMEDALLELFEGRE